MINPFHAVGSKPSRPMRPRRSCLSVPGSSPRMMARAADFGADEVFLDLEDAVTPAAKEAAREQVVEALNTNDYGGAIVGVRINDATTPYQYRDIVDIVAGAGARIDVLTVPKVQDAGQVWFLEHLLGQLEAEHGLARRIGLELQIETGTASVNMTDIARVTDRIESLIFGPGDYAADLGIFQLDIGAVDPDYPGHQWHHILAQIVVTARTVGCDAIDGPYGDYSDAEGLRESSRRAKSLGVDGKWCIHPSQIEIVHEEFTPSAQHFEHARRVLEAYATASEAERGAITLDGKMIDEASRKMAERVFHLGEAAGLR